MPPGISIEFVISNGILFYHGIMVEEEAIIKAKEECAQDESAREKNRKRSAARRKKIKE